MQGGKLVSVFCHRAVTIAYCPHDVKVHAGPPFIVTHPTGNEYGAQANNEKFSEASKTKTWLTTVIAGHILGA